MAKHHVIISGTGRAGTTCLVQVLTALGLETGFTDLTSAVHAHCQAGMEWNISHPNAPYFIKSPWLCDALADVLEHEDMVIDHALIPMRDLYTAAESRRDVTARTDKTLYPGAIPGGLWHTTNPEEQEAVLATQLYKLLYTLATRDIPLILLYFPRFIHDCDYLYRKIGFLLQGIAYARFREVFHQVVKPELVHHFRRPPPPP
jgi:hypothetical protein